MRVTIAEIAQALNYPYLQNGDGIVTGVSIDSRAVNKGDLFVALAGEQTDGHNYLAQALEQGAAGVVISREDAIAEYGLQNYILAEDGAVFYPPRLWKRAFAAQGGYLHTHGCYRGRGSRRN